MNGAAINYCFGSKDALVATALEATLAQPGTARSTLAAIRESRTLYAMGLVAALLSR